MNGFLYHTQVLRQPNWTLRIQEYLAISYPGFFPLMCHRPPGSDPGSHPSILATQQAAIFLAITPDNPCSSTLPSMHMHNRKETDLPLIGVATGGRLAMGDM